MLKTIVFIAVVFRLSDARPNAVKPFNVATAPPNCRLGQEWVNGECRDIWRQQTEVQNVVTVPPNCPPGQEYINGQCRDVWLARNNQQVWVQVNDFASVEEKNIIQAPPNCQNGQQFINGACRDIWRNNGVQTTNVVTVPPNCPEGQEYINGQCRDVWTRVNVVNDLEESGDNNLQPNLYKKDAAIQSFAYSDGSVDTAKESFAKQNQKNIISVPTQCPAGYRPDANGVCREIWNRVFYTTSYLRNPLMPTTM